MLRTLNYYQKNQAVLYQMLPIHLIIQILIITTINHQDNYHNNSH
jgi:hypothetical protein